MLAERWDASWAVVGMRATTPAGQRAKARVALALLLENREDDPDADDGDITAAISALRDVLGEVAA